jgi:hypothetical protein
MWAEVLNTPQKLKPIRNETASGQVISCDECNGFEVIWTPNLCTILPKFAVALILPQKQETSVT